MIRAPKSIVRKTTLSFPKITPAKLRERVLFHIKYSRCKPWELATFYDQLVSLSHAIRDLAVDRMVATQREYQEEDIKRVYYLSMEFLLGRSLVNNIISLGLYDVARKVMSDLGTDIDLLATMEEDAGLGNGGLGRLAACFLDSMATMGIPAYGYGLRYQNGMFRQEFENGWQTERPDDWLKLGSPWAMLRPEYTVPVLLYGRVEKIRDNHGKPRNVWMDWQMIEGVPYDLPILGYGSNTVNILRLWHSRAAESFRLDVFNQGDYIKAVEHENWAERITKVLYPSDNTIAGRELRFIQEYFLVACSIRDILRRYQKNRKNWTKFADKVAIQLNDTHPALTVAELMRAFVDEEGMPWEKAWELTVRACGYTNHTLMPEALERWPVPIFERVLPRHIQIIYEINTRFLNQVEFRFPDEPERLQRLSLIEESDPKNVRMANLAIVGSHSVNGVSKLHSELVTKRLVPDFAALWPNKFNNKTNGIAQRRWLLACNPDLSALITETIGDRWVTNLDDLRRLESMADDLDFRQRFLDAKRKNKIRLARLIKENTNLVVNPDSLFDVQVKRLHEYKRQLLNAMHIITLYHRLKDSPGMDIQPRTFVFGAKAAPGYHRAKLIIKLINDIANTINNDPDVRGRIKVVFVPNYCVSCAEIIIPAADLSEQISTAGTEASGTGNMKLALNGALTIGTWDGANIEIAEAVGLDNIFIFGLREGEISEIKRSGRHNPHDHVQANPELRRTLDAITSNSFNPTEPDLFKELTDSFLVYGDPYFHLADFRSYIEAHDTAAKAFRDSDGWARKAILNVARMGCFSSDRTITEYAEEIWDVAPLEIQIPADIKEARLPTR